MNPISTPSIAAFLHYMVEHHPDLTNLQGAGKGQLLKWIMAFEEFRGRENSPNRQERYWRDFIHSPNHHGFRPSRIFGTSDARVIVRDPLCRYLSVPNKIIFLYSDNSSILPRVMEKNWLFLHELSGDNCDVYDYTIVMRQNGHSYSRQFIQRLKPIPGIDYDNTDLTAPALHVWSHLRGRPDFS